MSYSPHEDKSTAMSQRPGKGRPRRKTARSRPAFRPSRYQLESAKHLIVNFLKQGRLYAHNLKEAAHELLKRVGRAAHELGRHPADKTITVMQALVELTSSRRIAYDGYCYKLS